MTEKIAKDQNPRIAKGPDHEIASDLNLRTDVGRDRGTEKNLGPGRRIESDLDLATDVDLAVEKGDEGDPGLGLGTANEGILGRQGAANPLVEAREARMKNANIGNLRKRPRNQQLRNRPSLRQRTLSTLKPRIWTFPILLE